MTIDEAKTVAEIVALVVVAAWAIYGFVVLKQREKAAAELRKVELESRQMAVVTFDIAATSERRPDAPGYCILADVTMVNKGKRDTRLKWDGESPAFAVWRTSFTSDGAPQFADVPIRVRVGQARHPGAEVVSTILRAGETQRKAFAVTVSEPGLYLLSFRAALAPEEHEVSRQAGADPQKGVSWAITKYIVVSGAIREVDAKQNAVERDCLIVKDTVDGVSLKAAPSFEPARSDEVFGSLKVSGPPSTLEEMDAGVLAEANRRHARD
jgi:hypothetical protein